ncbi:MAG TPA: hypothetical protein VH413_15985 [Verrucomicrobiae bacterium]|jgi:hypothetical protein|nr:hypothetical protein [Verrucomicrobiae bacterium]
MGTDVALLPADQWRELLDVEEELRETRARRAAIMESIASDNDEGQRILNLAGGRGWGDGRRMVTLQCSGMAARAARHIKARRGVAPSDTSLADAAAAAAAVMWYEWRCYSALCGDVWNETTMRHLATFGWRAAFRCLTSHQAAGRTGDRAGQSLALGGGTMLALDDASDVAETLTAVAPVVLPHATAATCPVCAIRTAIAAADVTTLAGRRAIATRFGGDILRRYEAGLLTCAGHALSAADVAALKSWARDRATVFIAPPRTEEERDAQSRRDVLRWIRSVLRVAAKGRTGAAERARFSVLARLVHGRDIATAARGAGFASGRAALESFRAGQVWPRLRAAITDRLTRRDKSLMMARARAVKAAMAAMAAQRAARAGCGKSAQRASVARIVSLVSGAVSAHYSTALRGDVPAALAGKVTLTLPASRRAVVTSGRAGRGAVHPLAADWSRATTARGEAVAVARAARAALRQSHAARLADWDAGTRGLRSGWLSGHAPA